MKLDLPTPGVPVSPTRSAGAPRAGSAREQRRAPRARWSARVDFDQRDRPRQRPPVAGREPRGQRRRLRRPRRHASFTAASRRPLASGRLFGIPGPRLSRADLPRGPRRCRSAPPCPPLALALGLAPAPPRAAPSEALLRLLRRRHPRRQDDARAPSRPDGSYTARQPHRHRRPRRDVRRLLLRRPAAEGELARRRHRGAGAASTRNSKSPRADRATPRSTGRTARRSASRSSRRASSAPDPATQARHARPGLRRLRRPARPRRRTSSATPPSTSSTARAARGCGSARRAPDDDLHLRRHLRPHRGRGAQPVEPARVPLPAGLPRGRRRPRRGSSASRPRPASAARCSNAGAEPPRRGRRCRSSRSCRRSAAALRGAGRAVLQAPPGAGKTTRVPLYLLERGLARAAS